MKRLYLLRHAKSSWKELSLSDKKRPLNKRGKHDAPLMAELFAHEGIRPDIILSSDAKRAYDTARIVADRLDVPLKQQPHLYEADLSALTRIVEEAFARYDDVMIVGHNPTLTFAVDRWSDLSIANLPTAGLVGIRFDSVEAFADGKGIAFCHLTPKKDLAAYS